MSPGFGFGLMRRRRTGGATPLAGYAWAVDFRNGLYRNGAQFVTDVATLTGYNFARAGAASEHVPGGGVHGFTAGVPAVVPGLGYVQRAAHTNLLLNAGQNNVLATQDVLLIAGQSYTLSFIGSGSVALSGAASGTLAGTGPDDRVRLTITASASANAAFTVSGDVRWAGLMATTTQGPIIPTAGTAATAPAGDLWFTSPDLSGDWLLVADLDFLESNTAIPIEEAMLSIDDGTINNRIWLCRNVGGGALRARRTIAGGSVSNMQVGASQTGTGRCLISLRKSGNDFTMGAIPAGGSPVAASLGTLTGWSAPFSRINIGKLAGGNIAHANVRFIGLEAGAFTDPQMQGKLEARL